MNDDTEDYRTAVASACAEDLSDVRTAGVVRLWRGLDTSGLPVLVLSPHLLPAACPFPRAFRYFLAASDGTTCAPYRLLLINSRGGITLSLVLRAAHAARGLPRGRRKALAAVSVMHPGLFLRGAVWALRPFVSSKLWEKVQMVDRVEELVLDGVFLEVDLLEGLLPEACGERERVVEDEAEMAREMARMQGFAVEEAGGSEARVDALRDVQMAARAAREGGAT